MNAFLKGYSPVKLVNHDGAEGLFTILCTNGFDLNKHEYRKGHESSIRHTCSICAGMSSASRSFNVTGFEVDDENRTEASVERVTEERD